MISTLAALFPSERPQIHIPAISLIFGVPGLFVLVKKYNSQLAKHLPQTKSAEDVVLNKFAAAATKNTTWTYVDMAEKPSEGSPTLARMRFAQWATYCIDYAWLFAFFGGINWKFSGDRFSVKAAGIAVCVLLPGNIVVDYLKGPILFPDIIAPVKKDHMLSVASELIGYVNPQRWGKAVSFWVRVLSGEGVVRDFSDRAEERKGALYHLFYFLKIFGFFTAAVCAQTALGLFHWSPFGDVRGRMSLGGGSEIILTNWAMVYLDYLAMSFIKDSTSMNVLHKLMHEKWYYSHKTHHMPMKELSVINLFYIDIPDLIVENVIAPVLILAMKAMWGPGGALPQLHLASFLLLGMTDTMIHSANPFSIGFFNPLLDWLMKCNISHNLHHALNKGHYTVWPYHQLSRNGVEEDVAQYNAIFKTKIFFEGSQAPMVVDERGIPSRVARARSGLGQTPTALQESTADASTV